LKGRKKEGKKGVGTQRKRNLNSYEREKMRGGKRK
jgi:hypothetical protein